MENEKYKKKEEENNKNNNIENKIKRVRGKEGNISCTCLII